MGGGAKARETWRAWAVHVFTALGAATAILALMAAIDGNWPVMFAWLALGLFIDGIDGTLARAARVRIFAPQINGDALDLVVDFLNYALVPLVAVWRAGLLSPPVAGILLPCVVAATALYFADTRMKTEDYWFRGFPALWNVAAVYLFAFRPPEFLCAAIIVALAALMFAPVAFVHPVRVTRLRPLTLCATLIWVASAALAISRGFDGGALANAGLALSGLYFVGLSAWRTMSGPPVD